METFIFLAIIGLLLYLPFRPTKVRRVITDQITWDLTDELHDIKCSIAEAKFMLESIESMRWNDRKEFEFSFINNVNLEGKTKSFRAMMTGLQDKKHLKEIKNFVRTYMEHQEEKYQVVMLQLYQHQMKINAKVTVQPEPPKTDTVEIPKTVNAYGFDESECDIFEVSGDEYVEA